MKPLGDTTDHFWRIQRMARITGTDLVAAFNTADLPATDYATMLDRCRACSDPGRCDRLLAAMNARADAPEFCENQSKLAQLKAAGYARAD